MKYFEANFATVVLRFYLMVGVVLLAGFTGMWWLAFLALPIVLSCMLCIKFTDKKEVKENTTKLVRMQKESVEIKAAV
ncbi:MAG: hypothetical protein AAFZ15_27780 [Bacteroidota bacterium]